MGTNKLTNGFTSPALEQYLTKTIYYQPHSPGYSTDGWADGRKALGTRLYHCFRGVFNKVSFIHLFVHSDKKSSMAKSRGGVCVYICFIFQVIIFSNKTLGTVIHSLENFVCCTIITHAQG